MQRIIYISTARATLSNAELDGVLLTARRNNAAVGVTGMLVVGGRRFLQALEGPDAAVDAVFARIAQDPRHYGGRHPVEEIDRSTHLRQLGDGVSRGRRGGIEQLAG